VDIDQLDRWMDTYGKAWVENDEDLVRSLFAEEAVYYVSPFKSPWVGREKILAHWLADPDAQENVVFGHDPLTATGDIGIARWNVAYTRTAGTRSRVEMDGILVLRFDGEGKCIEHREWYLKRENPI
jgi:hypothetical protein